MLRIIATKDPASGAALGVKRLEDLSNTRIVLKDGQEPLESAGLPRGALFIELCNYSTNLRVLLVEHPMFLEKGGRVNRGY